MSSPIDETPKVRVFISYSWTSESPAGFGACTQCDVPLKPVVARIVLKYYSAISCYQEERNQLETRFLRNAFNPGKENWFYITK